MADIKKFSGGSQKTLNEINISIVLDRVKSGSNISKSSLSKDLDISLPTISRIIDKLIENKYVEIVGLGKSSGGKKPTIIKFNAKRSYVIGIGVDINFINVVVADLLGNEVKSTYEKYDYYENSKDLIEIICKNINKIIRDTGIDENKIEVIAIGVPAVVEPDTGIIKFCPSIPVWENIKLGAIIEKKIGKKILVDNINYLALLGETWKGSAVGLKNVLLVGIGTGISAGILINGKLYRGTNNTAGEIGFMFVDRNLDLKVSSPYGQFEFLSSIAAIINEIKKVRKFDENKLMFNQSFVNNLLKDKKNRDLLHKNEDNLAFGISNLIAILNPELVVIKSEIYDDKSLFEYLVKKINTLIPFRSEIKLSILKENSIVIGACKYAIDYLEKGNLSPFFY